MIIDASLFFYLSKLPSQLPAWLWFVCPREQAQVTATKTSVQ
jgi:hypothetical protein